MLRVETRSSFLTHVRVPWRYLSGFDTRVTGRRSETERTHNLCCKVPPQENQGGRYLIL